MNSRLFKVTLVFLAGILIYSCSKDAETFEPYQDSGQVLNLLEKINDQTESYVFDAQKDQMIQTENEVIIQYNAGSLIAANGETMSGNVKLIFNEIISSGQSIFLGGSTKIEDKIFSSVSLLYIKFEDVFGNELELKEDQTIKIYHPRTEDLLKTPNRMFLGKMVENSLIWNEINDPKSNNNLEISEWNFQTNVGSIFGQGYTYTTSELGWHSLGDYLETDGIETQEICVDLPELFNKDNTKVFFVFEDLISIVDLQTFKENGSIFCGHLTNTMDAKKNYIITLSNTESGDYYLGFFDDPSDTQTLTIVPEKSTIEEISQFLYER